MGGQLCAVLEGLKPAGGMVLVQVVFAGVNVFYKLAINDGMDMRVLVTYRFLFASVFLGPLAFFLERKSRPKITWKVLMLASLCGLFGGSLAQNLYVSSMKLTSATFASAMTNLIPAITFILAVLFRLESLGIHSLSGQAKVLGTIFGISGAMLLTFYRGVDINIWSTNINLLKSHSEGAAAPHQEPGNHVMGSLLAVASCVCYAIWLIIQAKMMKEYPCHYSTTALMCLMGTVQSIIFALCVERDWEQWRLCFDIRLLAVIYSGVVGSGLILTVLAWCIKKKGPLYASIFNPLMLVIVALLSSLLLNEKLHLGSVLGAVLIVIGLYIVLWGKGREAAKVGELSADESIDVIIVSGDKGLQEQCSGPHGPSESKQ
ncbi:WAT1-related protein At1g25270 isoform X2 [Elaeis guineensis]|uniref:WAT1-related protein n=1 Tax=Elaeis guineensis var. tenera TaxID=51953 RepID=A0A6I9QN22_ELAGV|nr:WAT1-related protein At1g25270 [Elaeis guineensis]